MKPENLILSHNDQVVLCDFRISQMFKVNRGATQKMQGSIRFTPPERLGLSQLQDDMKVDMWQAGVTLYIMLTKEYPYDLLNVPECLN